MPRFEYCSLKLKEIHKTNYEEMKYWTDFIMLPKFTKE